MDDLGLPFGTAGLFGTTIFVLLLPLFPGCGGDTSSPTSPEPVSPPPPSVPTPVPETPAEDTPEPPIVLMVNFDTTPLGEYSEAAFDSDWSSYREARGLGTGRMEIVGGAAAYSGRSLRVKHPQGDPSRTQGIVIKMHLPQSYEGLYLSYRVKFEDGFDFVRGGKLPGLFGGRGNAGGNVPNGNDGWSARMMWREEGEATQYLYHPDQPGMYGEFLYWDHRFEPGVWHTLEHHVTMNTPGMRDGKLETWFDNVEGLHIDDLRFRDVDTFAIAGLMFATFFGGGDASWNASKDEYIYFDDFVISTEQIQQ